MRKCDVSLTVHLSMNLANDELDVQIFNTFFTILYDPTGFIIPDGCIVVINVFKICASSWSLAKVIG